MKKKIAIVSTFDELCGIAGYTKALVPQLSEQFDVTVFDLDQFVFRHDSKRVQRLADEQIGKICAQLQAFDHVNIQLEHGTLGRHAKDIYRRFVKLMHAAKSFSVTFHTVLQPPSFGAVDFFLVLRRQGLRAAYAQARSVGRNKILSQGIYSALRDRQKSHVVSLIFHTRRDARSISTLYRLKNVFDHPLVFFPSDARAVSAVSERPHFAQLARLPSGIILLGCFGFIGRYKGIDTAIKALKLLPEQYHLAIFGGLHPNEIKINQGIDPFIAELLGLIEPAKGWLDLPPNAAITLDGSTLPSLAAKPHPGDLSKRVHFLGALSDDDFPRAINCCDTVLLPYMEVGQSSSGPMGIATDLGKHIIAARTKAFIQNSRYNPGRFSLFEVGNFLQLSQLILAESKSNPPPTAGSNFNCATNARVYAEAASIS